jgi:hypothetical protein
MVPIYVNFKYSSNPFLLKSIRIEVMMTEMVNCSCKDGVTIRKQIKIILDFRPPPRSRLELRSSWLIRSVYW